MPPLRFRISIKAIVVRDGQLLTICRDDPRHGEWFLLPGGGQNAGESVDEALRREMLEETNCEIEIGPLVAARDYIGARHEFAAEDSDFHQVELMFLCRLCVGATPDNGHAPDERQTRVEWLEIARLPQLPFYPKTLGRRLAEDTEAVLRGECRYLGDVN